MRETEYICESNQGKRVFGPTGAYVKCVKCEHTFPNVNNVGNLPHHEDK